MTYPGAVARLARGLWPAAAIALLGTILLALPAGRALEQSLGLSWLYALRGDRERPKEVSIVAIDARAAAALGLPPNPKEWPRRLHAELLPYLLRAGARLVVLDLLFGSPREDDQILARAIAQAGNVILAAQLERDTEPLRDVRQKLVRESYVEPIALFADAALGVAPVVLPKTPRIDMFWAFKEEGWETPGLPAVALQAFEREAYPALRALASQHGSGAGLPEALGNRRIERTVWSVRKAFLAAGPPAPPDAHEPGGGAARLLALYAGEGVRYLNFYGGPAQIATHPYDRVLAAARGEPGAAPMDFAGKVVLIGLAELAQTKQRDNYHTVYSREDGVDLSGVEIAATAIANLLDGSSLRSPGPGPLAFMLAGTFMLGFACRLLPISAAAAIAVIAGAGYLLFARGQFAEALWWPVVVPLAVQTPAALGLGLWLQYRDVRRERDTIRRLLGVPAPNHALDRLARNLGPLPDRAGVVFSTCLNGDIEGYTELSEQLGPSALLALMNRYFETVFTPIRRNRGVVIDNTGDAMQAVWLASRPAPELRGRALQAGLDIHSALRAFNALGDHPPMNVLLGLHCGEVAFGPWGAEGRVENRVVGDVVNAAARIRALNKEMGTRLLASAQTLEELPHWLARPVGRFRLVGSQAALEVYQPLGMAAQADDGERWLCERSREALAAFTATDFEQARALWESVQARHPADGPARYHVALCDQMKAEPPVDWDGTIRQTRK
jgi:adenylate cyclase